VSFTSVFEEINIVIILQIRLVYKQDLLEVSINEYYRECW